MTQTFWTSLSKEDFSHHQSIIKISPKKNFVEKNFQFNRNLQVLSTEKRFNQPRGDVIVKKIVFAVTEI